MLRNHIEHGDLACVYVTRAHVDNICSAWPQLSPPWSGANNAPPPRWVPNLLYYTECRVSGD